MNIIPNIIACPTCAQSFEHTTGNAAGYAILFLLCVIVPMAAVIFICILRIAKRQKAAAAELGEDPYADPFLTDNSLN